MISGACLMIKREVFQHVGRFSEDYFMYAEDADLCHKVKMAGWNNWYVSEAAVVHFGGSSSKCAVCNFSTMMMRESIWRFLRKTHGDLYGTGYRCLILIAAFFRLGLLGVFFPVQALRRRHQSSVSSFRKWWAILLWSVRREAWLKESKTA